MCPQLGSTNHLEHAQVRPGTHSFPAKSATLAGCCRPGSVQSLRPGVQMSAHDGSWIPVYLLPTRLQHLWPSPPAIGWPWSSRFPMCETCFVRTEDVHLHTPAFRVRIRTHFLLILETVVFFFHLPSTTSKPVSSLSTGLAHAARLGFFYKKNTLYKFTVIIISAWRSPSSFVSFYQGGFWMNWPMMHSLLPVTDCSNNWLLVERRSDAVNHNNYVSSSVSSYDSW